MEELGLGNTRITDAGLEHLNGLTNLKELRLWLARGLTDDGKQRLREALPNCEISGD